MGLGRPPFEPTNINAATWLRRMINAICSRWMTSRLRETGALDLIRKCHCDVCFLFQKIRASYARAPKWDLRLLAVLFTSTTGNSLELCRGKAAISCLERDEYPSYPDFNWDISPHDIQLRHQAISKNQKFILSEKYSFIAWPWLSILISLTSISKICLQNLRTSSSVLSRVFVFYLTCVWRPSEARE